MWRLAFLFTVGCGIEACDNCGTVGQRAAPGDDVQDVGEWREGERRENVSPDPDDARRGVDAVELMTEHVFDGLF